jgi:hypothetical protein
MKNFRSQSQPSGQSNGHDPLFFKLAWRRHIPRLTVLSTVAAVFSSGLATNVQATTTAPTDPCTAITVTLSADVITDPKTKNLSSINGTALEADLLDSIKKADKLSTSLQATLNTVANYLQTQLDKQSLNTSPEVFAANLQAALRAACTTTNNKGNLRAAEDAAFTAGQFGPATGSEFSLYLGTVQSLQAQGGFTSNVEASLISRTLLYGSRLAKEDSTNLSLADEPLDGVFEITYSKIGALVKSTTSGTSGNTGTGGTTGSTGSSSSSTTPNPFTTSAGILRVNGSIQKQFGLGLGMVVGAGLTTLPQTSGSSSEARPREFVAGEFLADYGAQDNADHATGRVLIGVAEDKFWEAVGASTAASATPTPSEPRRLFLDGRIDSPGLLKSKSVKLSVRVYVDTPLSGHGPSDISISLLVSTTLESLFGGS